MDPISIAQSITQAREHSLLGQYDDALVFYDSAVTSIGGYIRGLGARSDIAQHWIKVKNDIVAETTVVQDIIQQLNSLKMKGNQRFVSHSPPRRAQAPQKTESPRRNVSQWPSSGNRPSAVKQLGGRVNSSKVLSSNRFSSNSPSPPQQKKTPPNTGKKRTASEGRGSFGLKQPKTASPKTEQGKGKEKKGNSHDDREAERPRFTDGEPGLIDIMEREILDVRLGVPWESIAGLTEAKQLLKEAVLLPLHFPQLFTGIKRPYKGILMYGPPGTGKTMLAKAVATECKSTFFNCSISSLGSKWKGESEKLVSILFRMARFHSPAVIFFDEIDCLGGNRGSSGGDNESSRRVMGELLAQMDGIESTASDAGSEERKTVVVIAATNYPWNLDEALKRRLEKRIYIPLPDAESRRAMLRIKLKDEVLAEDLDLDEFADRMEGFSGADIETLCHDVAMMGMKEKLKMIPDSDWSKLNPDELTRPITKEDFEKGLSKVAPSVGEKDLQKFEAWKKQYGSE
ncbi:putative Vacuolar protein sorting-associated protein 4 [Blattamonas nauphoetae]|uniref:Katanin p60 ATPase-containing subunit A1 n=1 Tax=Blattamonas nauphoetae TaxID=2049346 RepID=A0ABQ9XWJ0_9EUKA|nr:putative Vacuolar protein sorting-associated protein 4 [Blattamonas nauphoetae]